MGRPTRLHCNYVKQRQDTVDSIKWTVGYSRFKSTIFEFNVETGKKDTTPNSFLTVDGDSATDDEVQFYRFCKKLFASITDLDTVIP